MTNRSKLLLAGAVIVAGAAAISIPTFAQQGGPQGTPFEVAHNDGPRGGDHRWGGPGRGDHRWGGPGRGDGMRMMRDHMQGRVTGFFDTDNNGTVSGDEIAAALTKYDANKDGTLTLNEFEALHADFTRQRMVRGFQMLDRDGDAKVTGEEFSRPLERMAKRMDDNRDHRGPRGPYGPNDRR